MSRKTPIQFEIVNPQGLDAKIAEIQERMKTTNLSWNKYSFARGYRFTKENPNGSVITYPAVYQGKGKDYLDVFPDDNFIPYSFVYVDQPHELESENNGWHDYSGNIAIIVVFRLKDIGTENNYRFIELLKYDTIETLKMVPDLEINEIVDDDIELCFSEFSSSEIEVQYLSEQFGALRFDCSISYSINCELINTY